MKKSEILSLVKGKYSLNEILMKIPVSKENILKVVEITKTGDLSPLEVQKLFLIYKQLLNNTLSRESFTAKELSSFYIAFNQGKDDIDITYLLSLVIENVSIERIKELLPANRISVEKCISILNFVVLTKEQTLKLFEVYKNLYPSKFLETHILKNYYYFFEQAILLLDIYEYAEKNKKNTTEVILLDKVLKIIFYLQENISIKDEKEKIYIQNCKMLTADNKTLSEQNKNMKDLYSKCLITMKNDKSTYQEILKAKDEEKNTIVKINEINIKKIKENRKKLFDLKKSQEQVIVDLNEKLSLLQQKCDDATRLNEEYKTKLKTYEDIEDKNSKLKENILEKDNQIKLLEVKITNLNSYNHRMRLQLEARKINIKGIEKNNKRLYKKNSELINEKSKKEKEEMTRKTEIDKKLEELGKYKVKNDILEGRILVINKQLKESKDCLTRHKKMLSNLVTSQYIYNANFGYSWGQTYYDPNLEEIMN